MPLSNSYGLSSEERQLMARPSNAVRDMLMVLVTPSLGLLVHLMGWV